MAAIAARTASVLRPHLRAVCFVPQLTAALGFEDGGLIGLASLRKPTNKDLLFMIDISYSMDEIAGYEDGMDAIDQRDNKVLTKRLNVAGAELGELTISLMWHNTDDLDLHVINPNGEHICYNARKDECTGELDVDMNNAQEHGNRITQEPVENAYWQDPPKGRYEIFVTNASQKDERERPRDYVVRVKQPGNMTFYRGCTNQPGKEASRWPPRGQSHMIDYPIHPDWNGGTRITNATNNALTIYDKFTTRDDHVGLIWFNHEFHYKMELQPRVDPASAELPCGDLRCSESARRTRGVAQESVKRAKGEAPRIQNGQRNVLDSTRRAVKGGTAFFDALIKAVAQPPRSSGIPYLVALTDGADSDSHATLEDAEYAIGKSPWTVFIIGLEVDPATRIKCERLASASAAGLYMHAADAGAGLDEAFAAVASQFVLPTVKSADAAASGGQVREV